MPANTLKENNEVSNKPLMAALQATGNPERELSTTELNQMKRRTPAPCEVADAKKTKGGKTSIENCQMLCKTHNRAKGNR